MVNYLNSESQMAASPTHTAHRPQPSQVSKCPSVDVSVLRIKCIMDKSSTNTLV